jgi:hypothetical protein
MVLENIDAQGRAQTVTVEVMPEGQQPPFLTSPIRHLAVNAVWCAPKGSGGVVLSSFALPR